LAFAQASAPPADAWAFNKEPVSRFYVGGSLSWVHHTGYIPNKTTTTFGPNSIEAYVFGGKLLAGYRFNRSLQFEVGLHHLGNATFLEGFPTGAATSQERSYAFSGSVLYNFPSLADLFGRAFAPAHLFLRGGLAYKNIHHTTPFGSAEEGVLSLVLGTGVEVQIDPRWFARVEVEHLSTAIGGPTMSTPWLKGLVSVDLGGTNRVVNVMHTQIMFTLGHNL
jgi:hypothetical protein